MSRARAIAGAVYQPPGDYRRIIQRAQQHPYQVVPDEREEEMWNESSPEVQIIGLELQRAGVGAWNNQRVSALCKRMKCTIWVLAAKAGAFRAEIDLLDEVPRYRLDVPLIKACWLKNKWPILLAVQFDRFERYLDARATGGPLLSAGDHAALKSLPSK